MPSQLHSAPEFANHVDGHSFSAPSGSEIHYRVKDLSMFRNTEEQSDQPNVLVVFHPNKASIPMYYHSVLDFNYLASHTAYSHLVFWDYPNSGFSKAPQWLADKNLLVSDGISLVETIAEKMTDGDISKLSFYGWSLGGGIASEVALALQNKYGDDGVISSITLDRTFTSISDHLQKNLYMPKTIADFASWALGIDFNTEWAFETLKAGKKKVYYIKDDDRIGDAVFKSGQTGEFIEVVELIDHGDMSHLYTPTTIEF